MSGEALELSQFDLVIPCRACAKPLVFRINVKGALERTKLFGKKVRLPALPCSFCRVETLGGDVVIDQGNVRFPVEAENEKGGVH